MRLPKINQKVSLRILKGSWEGLYSTYVEGIDERALTLAQPMYGGATVPLLLGEEVIIEFIDGGERLVFSAEVLRQFTQIVPLVSVTLPSPGSIRRHQQRDFVRLDANLPVRYHAVPAEEQGEKEATADKEGKVYIRGRTMDISGSGAQIVTHEAYPVGTKLDLLLSIQGAEVPIQAEVVRIAQSPTAREIWLGVRFKQVEERDRERIVRFIFSEQRFRRQKGLL